LIPSLHRAGLAGLTFLLALAAPVRSFASPPPDILLITVDTLRPDHLGLYGYPRATSPEIERWFTEGAVFEHAYAPAAYTSPSVVSILTGLLPQHHGVRLFLQKLPPGVTTVGSRLAQHGYQTAAVVSNPVLTGVAIGLDREFQYYDDHVDEREPYRDSYQRNAAATTDAAERWLREVRDPARPHFLWVHYMDPHGPYLPPADKPVDFTHLRAHPVDARRIPRYQRHPGIRDGNEYVDLYDEEIAFVDREVGRLLAACDSLGFLKNSIVLLTADHGERLLEKRSTSPFFFLHGDDPFEEEIRVPLAVRGAGFPPSRVDVPVSLLGIAATILSAAGAPAQGQLDGTAISPHPTPGDVIAEARGKRHWKCLIRDGVKWMIALDTGDGDPVHRWRFDLTQDPDEKHPLKWGKHDAGAARLAGLVASDPDRGGTPSSYIHGRQPKPADAGPLVAPGADSSRIEMLRSLGYV
jgi:choline-sulfatase